MPDADFKTLKQSFLIPIAFLVLMWLVYLAELTLGVNWYFLGVFPMHLDGLQGIITSPFIHKDLSHIFSNSVPFLVLGAMLFYWYRSISFKVLAIIWLFTGLMVWLIGRPSWHIGASGITYGLTAFLFTSGVLSKNPRLYAISLVIIFFYGSMVWGVFPDFFPKQNISWESHAAGLIIGIILAVFYRDKAPKRIKYSWEIEEEIEEQEEQQESPIVHITYNVSPSSEHQKK